MKKEIREKIAEFKKREANLLFVIMQKPEQSVVNKLLLSKIKKDKIKWLREIGGDSPSISMEDSMKLDELVEKASGSISAAALRNAQLQSFIEEARKTGSDMGRYYEVMIENYGQLEALSEMTAADHIRALEKFNNKINGRSFLSVLMCKFKKAKKQENESVKTDGNEKQ